MSGSIWNAIREAGLDPADVDDNLLGALKAQKKMRKLLRGKALQKTSGPKVPLSIRAAKSKRNKSRQRKERRKNRSSK